MLLVPLPLLFYLCIGASRSYAGDIARLRYLECRVEEEVGLPMLECRTVGGEDYVECGSGGRGGERFVCCECF